MYTQEHKKLEFAVIIQINLYSNLHTMLHIQPYIRQQYLKLISLGTFKSHM